MSINNTEMKCKSTGLFSKHIPHFAVAGNLVTATYLKIISNT
jgi:hypothetical protein